MAKKNNEPSVTFVVNDLKKALAYVGAGVKSNPIVPVLENVRVSMADGKATFTSSDLRTTLQVEIPYHLGSETEQTFLLPFGKFKSLVEKTESDTLELIPGNLGNSFGHTLLMHKATYKLAGENPIDYPMPKQSTLGCIDVTIDGDKREDFLTGLESTIFTVSKDELRPAMTGVNVRLDGGIKLGATDGHTLVRYTIPTGEFPVQSVILRPEFVQTLIRLLDANEETLTLTLYPGYVIATVGSYSVQTVLIDERFPDYEGAIPLNNSLAVTINRAELIAAVSRVLLVANATTTQLRFSFGATNLSAGTRQDLTIHAEDLDYGNEGSEQVTCVWGSEPFEIGFQGKLLLKYLQKTDGEQVTFKLSAPNRGMLITGSDANFLGMVMPVMLNTYA